MNCESGVTWCSGAWCRCTASIDTHMMLLRRTGANSYSTLGPLLANGAFHASEGRKHFLLHPFSHPSFLKLSLEMYNAAQKRCITFTPKYSVCIQASCWDTEIALHFHTHFSALGLIPVSLDWGDDHAPIFINFTEALIINVFLEQRSQR